MATSTRSTASCSAPAQGDRVEPRYRQLIPRRQACARHRRCQLPLTRHGLAPDERAAHCAVRRGWTAAIGTPAASTKAMRSARRQRRDDVAAGLRVRHRRAPRHRHSRLRGRTAGWSVRALRSAKARWSRSPCGSASCTRCGKAACASGTMRARSSAASINRPTTFLLHRRGSRRREPGSSRAVKPRSHHVESEGRPLVLKPLFGSQGKGIRLIETASDLPRRRGRRQHLLSAGILAPGGPSCSRTGACSLLAAVFCRAMSRQSARWITNVHQGGDTDRARPRPGDGAAGTCARLPQSGPTMPASISSATPDGQLLRAGDQLNPSWKGLQSVSRFRDRGCPRRGFSGVPRRRARVGGLNAIVPDRGRGISSPPAKPSCWR